MNLCVWFVFFHCYHAPFISSFEVRHLSNINENAPAVCSHSVLRGGGKWRYLSIPFFDTAFRQQNNVGYQCVNKERPKLNKRTMPSSDSFCICNNCYNE